ncbi:MAG: bifunctional glutamate N-acetyltransferase/amino-acid acetyltransferase ArgJ [Acidimicrobiaceae bacterium]|nr:bifunctional glutamate N-acetyltransferase/amino-acid acetyltransferase ArgJ [Acidimicrobiaceae bacterium]MXZ95643.1 bifunctional glutamate N-acetyltransferase/amino-acid acetyltransferase ArgJ [Acidimicrobiaceae bacterium]MYF42500.1 bifunctional glutamate N-acetyltransferase/amino-acid acetyltransferase ArgJ [Acidimicrobiaceae bacterium]MYJ34966.1 bifunctional glutamate N-acetyltransferase/amino-acid acetyltransferase ArgJ [Acidimicrobiaceae bacterium]
MAETKVSPLAPAAFPVMPGVKGLRLATAAAGIRYRGRDDVMLAELPPGSTVAGTFTRSLCTAAPVDWCKDALVASGGYGQAIIVNSGNANAFTGAAGYRVAEHTAGSVAAALGAQPHEVLVASTGVIAEDLPVERIVAALPAMVAGLEPATSPLWEASAAAIGTTDTFPKAASAPVHGTSAHVAGIAKGSGMIAPDMATMLAFVFTDMAMDPPTAQECLAGSVEKSFNRITVDSDTSTSDTVLLAATGTSGHGADLHPADFRDALDAVMLDLAHQIVRDGEGATKFVAVTATGAADDAAAEAIARAVADSPLVKTALAASDANWGRIVAAVGKAGQRADRDRLSIWIGDEQCAEGGLPRPGYSEQRATEHLLGDSIDLRIDVGVGDGTATIWTCDLTHGYIDINAGYRT